MKNIQYKDQSKKNYNIILIVLFVMIFILLCLCLLLSKVQKNVEIPELSYDNLKTVKDVVEYYKSKYISEKQSLDENYSLDISVEFSVLPYDEKDNSNEKYYNDLLGDVAKVIRYSNFKMIDKKNDITIKVICQNGKIASIIINDIEDYFIYMDSQISMKQYVEIPKKDFLITSGVLWESINNNWNSANFGTRESIFDEYYIYFDEGIKVRTINNKIYNIVFDNKYVGNVIESLFPGVDLKTVEDVLGKPSFEDEELKILGYKGEEIYVFFSENEISVYRNTDTDADDFFKLADDFINEKKDLLDFMNELTYIWPDYSEYDYTSSSVFISYPLKGIEIKINYDDTNGILVYNNIKSNLSKVSRYLENTNFVARLQLDSIFETEKRIIKNTISLKAKCKEYRETLDSDTLELIGESIRYDIYPDLDNAGNIYSMKFISTVNGNPNRELNDSIDSYLWINNDTFLYSKKGKGIYSYDLENGVVTRFEEGTEDYDFKSFKNGILKYDDKQIMLQY